MLRYLCLVLITISPFVCKHAAADIALEHLTTESGIEFVNGLFRDSQGYLWATTNTQGLARFDGRSTKWYRHDQDDPTSLSNNRAQGVSEDADGNIWVGTALGLHRLNKQQNGFIYYHSVESNPRSLADSAVVHTITDKHGHFWVLTRTGLHRYVPETDDFTRFDKPEEFTTGVHFLDLVQTEDGMFWMTSSLSGVHSFDPESNKFEFHHNPNIPPGKRWRRQIEVDPDQSRLWLALSEAGLYSFNIESSTFTHYPVDPDRPAEAPPSQQAYDVLHLDPDNLAIAYDQSGLCIFNKKTKRFTYLGKKAQKPTQLISDGIYTLHKDYEGILWVGTTRAGIYYSNPNRYKFETYTPNLPDIDSRLSGHLASSIYEDSEGGIWIGTDGSGINYLDRNTGKITIYNTDNSSLSSGTIRNIIEDNHGTIWVATWDAGLNRFDKATKQLQPVGLPEIVTSQLGHHGIWRLAIDQKNRFWITSGPNLFVLDEHLTLIKQHTFKGVDFVAQPRLFTDEDFILNINTHGANIIDVDTLELNPLIENEKIIDMARDADGRYYFATAHTGILIYEPDLTYLKTIYNADTFSKTILRSLQVGNDNAIWASSENGMYRIPLDSEKISHFSKADGLQGNAYFPQSSARLRDGTIVFGGTDGVSFWKPETPVTVANTATVQIDEFRIWNVSTGFEGLRLSGSNDQKNQQSVTMDWDKKMFGIGFTTVDFTYPEKTTYAYKLNGFDQDWVYTDSSNRLATYTNLDPGEYEFVVRAANSQGVWTDNDATLKVFIAAPFWMKSWFHLLSAVIAFVIIYAYIRYRSRKQVAESKRLKTQIEERSKLVQEMAVAKNRAEESDRLKSLFLANMSHEIRTPMNAILGFSQLLSDSTYSDEEKASFVEHIGQGSESLLHIIEDILDYSMIEANQLKVQNKPFRLDDLLDQLYARFIMQPKRDEVEFRTHGLNEAQGVIIDSDPYRLTQIISNLLSNALKFTQAGYVEFGLRKSPNDYTIYVKDTAGGMDQTEKKAIYSEFVRLERHEKDAIRGVGLGLAISHRLACLLDFKLSLESELGSGSEFYVQIPINKVALPENKLSSNKQHTPSKDYNWEAQRILIAEDDNTNVAFLKKALEPSKINVDWAKNGEDAVNYVKEHGDAYDLILMDISMPIMGGYEALELIRKLRPNLKVVAQTAHSMQQDRERLEQAGFEDQLYKPIKKTDLLSTIAKFL
ncbi:MAG: two-component regulator propeller domain-containing protein [Opitutaceae bacterium]